MSEPMRTVLHTGFTATHTGTSRMKIFGMADAIDNMCESQAWVVDRRPAVPDEDLSKYDFIVVGMASPASLGSRDRWAGVFHCLMNSPVPVVMYTDDWRNEDLISNIKRFADRPSEILKKLTQLDFKHEDWIKDNVDDIARTMGRLYFDSDWPTILAPFFKWGDITRYTSLTPQLAETLVPLDITPLTPIHKYQRSIDDSREEAFTLATLSNFTSWLGQVNTFGWPVVTFGHKKLGGEKIAEADMLQEYHKRWGVLSPPYKHAGSGWWRNRFVFAADAYCFVLADHSEVRGMGDAYQHYQIQEAVRRGPRAISALAQDQRGWLTLNTDKPRDVRRKFYEAMTEAKSW